jgi:hypothetical protein
MIELAGVQAIEIGDAVDADEQHGLAIDHELPVPVLQRSLDDPRKATGPVVAAPRDQAHAITVAGVGVHLGVRIRPERFQRHSCEQII